MLANLLASFQAHQFPLCNLPTTRVHVSLNLAPTQKQWVNIAVHFLGSVNHTRLMMTLSSSTPTDPCVEERGIYEGTQLVDSQPRVQITGSLAHCQGQRILLWQECLKELLHFCVT